LRRINEHLCRIHKHSSHINEHSSRINDHLCHINEHSNRLNEHLCRINAHLNHKNEWSYDRFNNQILKINKNESGNNRFNT